jgi:hypothetical protein
MEKLQLDITRYIKPQTTATSERAELIGQFTDRLNATRGGKFKTAHAGFRSCEGIPPRTRRAALFFQAMRAGEELQPVLLVVAEAKA